MRRSRERWSTRDRLYSSGHSDSSPSVGYRKIISLVALLVLIVACIFQLNDPHTFEPLLQAIGLTTAVQSENAQEQEPALQPSKSR